MNVTPQQRELSAVVAAERSYWIKTLAMAIPAIMLGLQISEWIAFLPAALQGHPDFRHLYTAAYMVRTGQRSALYDYDVQRDLQNRLATPEPTARPFNHLAYEALLFVPYSYVQFRVAYLLWLTTNVGLLVIVIRLLRPWTKNIGAVFRWLPPILIVTFLAVPTALIQGQDSIVLLVLLVAAFVLLTRAHHFYAGLMVGLAVFKFQIVIPLAALFFLWRRWRFLGGFTCAVVCVGLISLSLAGIPQTLSYLHSLLFMSVKESALDHARFGIFPVSMPNLRGLVYTLSESHLSPFWVQALTLGISAAVFVWIAIAASKRNAQLQFLLATSAAAFLSYHLYIHDLCIVVPSVLVILNSHFGKNFSGMHFPAAAAAILYASPAVTGLSSTAPFVLAIPLALLVATHSTWIWRTRPEST